MNNDIDYRPYFKYISRDIYHRCTLSEKCKDLLNKLINSVSERIEDKIIQDIVIEDAIRLVLNGDLITQALLEGQRTLKLKRKLYFPKIEENYTGIFLAAVLEYLTAELIENSKLDDDDETVIEEDSDEEDSDEDSDEEKCVITSSGIINRIKNDKELMKLFMNDIENICKTCGSITTEDECPVCAKEMEIQEELSLIFSSFEAKKQKKFYRSPKPKSTPKRSRDDEDDNDIDKLLKSMKIS
jgi:hypothetical protein